MSDDIDEGIRAKLRNELRRARDDGLIEGFDLRHHGLNNRATIRVSGGKFYTQSTLDTLALLNRLRGEAMQP